MISSALTGLGMIVLAVYNLYHGDIPATYNWIPIVSFSFTMFIGSLGLGPVPFILPFDVLPLNVNYILFATYIKLRHSKILFYGF